MNISVIGLGKVGITLTSCLIAAGHKVVGADLDAGLVSALNDGRYTTPEPGVMERLSRARPGDLRATTNTQEAVLATDVTFVIVPTPSNSLGGFSVRFVLAACHQIGQAMRQKSGTHTVAIMSTMLPGSSDTRIIPCLEAASGKKVGQGLGYCYNPSFIALGEIVKGIETPDYLLIGEADAASGDTILAIHKSMAVSAPGARMTPIEGEITKIASNTHETMRVSFANMLLSVCSEVPGANVDRITEALTYRMGKRFFKGAVPYGGPCWPRDNQAFAAFLDTMHTPATLPRAVDTFNDEHGRYVLHKILDVTARGQWVGILGLAYKPGTPVIERAFAADLARWLSHEGRRVIGWDPQAMDEFRSELGNRVEYAESGDDLLRRSDVAVITLPMKELETLDWSLAKTSVVVDCWRCLSTDRAAQVGHYVALGKGPAEAVAPWLERVAGSRMRLLTD